MFALVCCHCDLSISPVLFDLGGLAFSSIMSHLPSQLVSSELERASEQLSRLGAMTSSVCKVFADSGSKFETFV